MKAVLIILGILALLLGLLSLFAYRSIVSFPSCSGIAALDCPDGYSCKSAEPAPYPDAGGVCVPKTFPWSLLSKLYE